MRIDLHTHSNRSDGTDTPGVLVAKASAAGLNVVALTDHDSAEGWADARDAARQSSITFVPGIEVSTRWRGAGVHVLAYFADADHPEFASELARIRSDRRERIRRIVAGLKSAGLAIRMDDVLRHAEAADSVGRPHVADALVELGYVQNRSEAFATWLTGGRPGHVAKYAPETRKAIHLIRVAGGVSVLAHAWGRGSRRVLDGEAIAMLSAAGLDGLEVDHLDHDDDHRRALHDIARDLDLIVTGSSDYHGTGKTDHPLGAFTTAPREWERLASLATMRGQQNAQGA